MSNSQHGWFTYIIRCSDGTLYTGITKDLQRRVAEHNSGIGGAKYTKSRRPVKLIFAERAQTRSLAAKKEYQIKKMPLAKKLKTIENSDWNQSKEK